jgi:hypothetical protein
MAAPPVINLGDLLADGTYVFRAFAEKSHRSRNKNAVRYFAYLLREEDARDGLSVGLTPDAAVRNLRTNEGYCQILVGVHHLSEIHRLPYQLEVRADATDPNHAFICNLPLSTISDDHRERAIFIAHRLAEKSQVVTCDSYAPAQAL